MREKKRKERKSRNSPALLFPTSICDSEHIMPGRKSRVDAWKCPKPSERDPSSRQGDQFISLPQSLTVSSTRSSFFRTGVPDWHSNNSNNKISVTRPRPPPLHRRTVQTLVRVRARVTSGISSMETDWGKVGEWNHKMLLVTQWSVLGKSNYKSKKGPNTHDLELCGEGISPPPLPPPVLNLEGFLEVLPEVVSVIYSFYDADVCSNVFCLLRLAVMMPHMGRGEGGGLETRPLSLRVHVTVSI